MRTLHLPRIGLLAPLALLHCGAPVPTSSAPDDLAMVQADLHRAPPDFASAGGDLGGCEGGGGPCQKGTACCRGACVDVLADARNCGICGFACPDGNLCCAGACVDPRSDTAHCGGCGLACMLPHVVGSCADGACTAGRCQLGWADCNQRAEDGCEVHARVDVAHCGGCDKTCSFAHGKPGCASTCYLRACEFGFDDCNGDEGDGCETSVLADVRSCGGCGVACPARANAKIACVLATCALASCNVGWDDCDRNPLNGCEVPIGSDSKNCGGCGVVCPGQLICRNGGCTCPNCNFANATSKCENNQCLLEKCVVGFADCDGNAQNGCEAELLSDGKNCGGCGKACPNGNLCISGQCSLVLVSDANWKHTRNLENGWQNAGFDDSQWAPAIDEGAYGTPPWNRMPAFDAIQTAAHWIWYYDSRNLADNSTVYFRRSFSATTNSVTIVTTADDNYLVYLDGQQVAQSNDVWSVVHTWKVNVTPGKGYVVAVRVTNTGGPGGLLFDLR